MFDVMDSKGVDAFGGVKDWRLGLTSGYEMFLKRLCNLVKSMVLADISIKILEMIFRTFVHFGELF